MTDYTKPASSLDNDIVSKGETTTKAVIDGVKHRKKSAFQKFSEAFFVGDFKTIKECAIKDVIIPAAKRTFRDLVMTSIDMLLFDTNRRPSNSLYSGTQNTKYTSYSSYYYDGESLVNKKKGLKPVENRVDKPTDYTRFLLRSPSDADKVLSAMRAEILMYDKVKVRQLCEFCGEPYSPADENYGWYNLDTADYKFVSSEDGDGYVLDLPSSVPLER